MLWMKLVRRASAERAARRTCRMLRMELVRRASAASRVLLEAACYA
jgi:hypothetical protein